MRHNHFALVNLYRGGTRMNRRRSGGYASFLRSRYYYYATVRTAVGGSDNTYVHLSPTTYSSPSGDAGGRWMGTSSRSGDLP